MENIVLYRKYRPQGFAQIIGQKHIVQTLTNSLKANSLAHAYLFCGPRGSGKTTMARLLAKAVNCQTKSGIKPCNECLSCQEILQNKSLDLVEIDAASHTGVEEVRELIEGLKFAPVSSKYKVFIIDECHQLSKSAANALLKTLEEPPAHAIFILATTESHKMIPTIVSRCQRFDFKRLQNSEIIEKLEFILKKEGVAFEESALTLIALNARGSFRDAESLLDKCLSFASGKLKTEDIKDLLGMVEVLQISKLIDLLLVRDTKGALTYINDLTQAGVDMQEFAKTLVFYLRQALISKIDPHIAEIQNAGLSKEETEILLTQIAQLPEKDWQKILEIFIDAENKMKYAVILQLPLELAVVEVCHQGEAIT